MCVWGGGGEGGGVRSEERRLGKGGRGGVFSLLCVRQSGPVCLGASTLQGKEAFCAWPLTVSAGYRFALSVRRGGGGVCGGGVLVPMWGCVVGRGMSYPVFMGQLCRGRVCCCIV